jgi:hypothetical protein
VTTNAVLDASVLTALFDGHDLPFQLLQESEKGASRLILPAVAVAEAETSRRAGYNGWSLLFFSSAARLSDWISPPLSLSATSTARWALGMHNTRPTPSARPW